MNRAGDVLYTAECHARMKCVFHSVSVTTHEHYISTSHEQLGVGYDARALHEYEYCLGTSITRARVLHEYYYYELSKFAK